MSLYNYEKPWLFPTKGIAFIIMGVFSIIQVSYTLPVLLLIFALLLGFTVFMRFGEVFWLKEQRSKTSNITLGIVSLLFLIWFIVVFDNFEISSDSIDNSRIMAFIVILIWLGVMAFVSLIESLLLLKDKNYALSNIFLIDAILVGVVTYFFYIVINNLSERTLEIFGIVTLAFGVINILLGRLLSRVASK